MTASGLATPTPGQVAGARPWIGRPLLALLALAFAVRVAALLAFPSIHHPDEAFQLFEQGHRLAFGYGVKPWEFEDGLRSLVTPYVLAGLYAISEPIFGGPEGYIRFAQIVLAALSLIPVAAIYRMGLRIGPTHALLAGLVAATWFELVYFSFRPLTEALAADAVLVALALGAAPLEQMSQRRLMAIGFCLALAAMLRIHLAPGLAFVAVWQCRLQIRDRWAALLLGATPALLVFGAADWATWGAPFASLFNAIWVNAGQNRASYYGVDPMGWYMVSLLKTWNLAFPAMAVFIALRIRRSVAWIGFAAVVIASHSLIPHKEYRFIFPAVAALVVVAALGSADLIERLRPRLGPDRMRGLVAGAAGLWITASVVLAALPTFSANWGQSREVVLASYWLSHRPDLCGVALYDNHWFETGGYAFLHRDVPLYPRLDRAEPANSATAYNYVIGRRADLAILPSTYRLAWCGAGGACILERPGACASVPGLVPIARMPRLGEPAVD